MFRKFGALVFLFVFAFAQVIKAQDKSASELAAELMVKSGLSEQIRHSGDVLKMGILQGFNQSRAQALANGKTINPAFMKRLPYVITNAYDAAAIEQLIKKKLETGLSPDVIRILLKWLDSPLGKKITRMEEDASTAQAKKEIMMAGDVVAKSKNPEKRRELLSQLINAVQSEKQAVDQVINMQMAMLLAAQATLNPKNLSFDKIRSQTEKSRERIRAMVSRHAFISSAYTYQGLTDSELARYMVFLKSDAGAKYTKVTGDALNEVFLEIAGKVGEDIANLLKQTVARGQFLRGIKAAS